MNCDECRARYLEGDEGSEIHEHLDRCAACRARQHDLDVGRSLLEDAAMWEEPSPELATQVERLIRSDEPRRVHRPRWLGWPTVAAAAVAVVLVGAGLYLSLRAPAPDWEVAVLGTALAPEASAVVQGWTSESGTRLVVNVEGLEAAPDGFVYEFWLSKGRLHNSAGTFTAGGELELRSGVSRGDFPRLWVTLEPLDEDEGPTTHTVLDTGR